MAYSDIKDPSAYFQTKTYTGTNNSNALTNDGNSDLKPDFIWIKRRDYNNGHQLLDSTRGVDKILGSELSSAETTLANRLSSFDTDGFTVESSSGAYNASGEPFAAWQWKANGGTTSSNTDGTITSTVQANQDAGFSIVTYTGTGVYNKTVGHGLGIAPAVVILKNRTTGEGSYDDWWVYHKNLSNPVNRGLRLNETGAEQATTVLWSVVPSSTIFGVGGSVNQPRYTNADSDDYIAYCFAEKQGYSKFGSYVGNGSTNGPFVYTGFKPALIITKNADGTDSWNLLDNKRSPHNAADKYLQADNANAEGTYTFYDILSNGFKIRNTGNANISGNNITYMAFAENPFVAGGVPTTAR